MPRETVPVHLPYLRRLLLETHSESVVRSIMRRIRETPEGDARQRARQTDEALELAAQDMERLRKRTG